jgi:Na+-translocating ferredoxin:NAD+ oxidoreductase RnfG subunit
MTRSVWYIVAAAPAVIASPAWAVDYLSAEQAQHALFPEASGFQAVSVSLTDEQRERIKKLSGTPQRNAKPAVWKAIAGGKPLGWVVVDEVIGKHEYITYATAISPAGAVLGIEIMSYRETKGGEVRNPKWRAQFTGMTLARDKIRLGKDIANISGATLSCRNLTDGMKRLLALHRVALAGPR